MQSVPRLSSALGVNIELLEERMIYGLSGDEATAVLRAYDDTLRMLIAERGVTWLDVYEHTDVGRERQQLIEEMQLASEDCVLEVACGRGYTTIALANRVEKVSSIDLMNGYGRTGWWSEFRAVMDSLGLGIKVSGVRSDASCMPFRDGAFPVTLSAHAMRNFPDRETIVATLREMLRVTCSGGRVIIAENIPVTNRRSQEAHLRMYNLKTRFVRGDKPLYTKSEYLEMFGEAGLELHHIEILDMEYSATPPIFIPDLDDLQKEKVEVREQYQQAVKMIREHGESSTSVLVVEAEIR